MNVRKRYMTVIKCEITEGNIYRLLINVIVGGDVEVVTESDSTALWHIRFRYIQEQGLAPYEGSFGWFEELQDGFLQVLCDGKAVRGIFQDGSTHYRGSFRLCSFRCVGTNERTFIRRKHVLCHLYC